MPWAKHETVADEAGELTHRLLYAVAGELFEPGAEVSLVDPAGTVVASRVVADEFAGQEAWCWVDDRADLIVLVNGEPLGEQAWPVVVGTTPLRRLEFDSQPEPMSCGEVTALMIGGYWLASCTVHGWQGRARSSSERAEVDLRHHRTHAGGDVPTERDVSTERGVPTEPG